MMHPDPTLTYRAPRWLLWLVVGAVLVFAAVAAVAVLVPSVPSYGVWVSVGGVMLALGGLTEVLFGKVTLEEDCVAITHWFRTERVPLRDVAAVSLEGGRTSLRLITGGWKLLPEWLGADQSLGKRIRDRLVRSHPQQG
jgi:hypothetical protein